MKRVGFLILLGLITTTFIVVGCGSKKAVPVQEEAPPVVAKVDTVKPEPPPPPPPPKPKLVEGQLMTIYFDFDKFNLRTDAKSNLDKNYQLLKEYPNAMIRIEGNCDERGTVEYNLSLGEKRANAARDYLVGLGIAANRLSTISYGEEKPVDPGHNEQAWAKNRRAEFRIVSQ